jgi:hypothetical protein
MNIQDLITQYGAYYLGEAGALNRQRLMARLYQRTVTSAYFGMLPSSGTVYRIGLALLQSVVQSFQKAWTPKGNLAIDPKSVNLHQFKIDIEEIPAELEATWAGFLTQWAMDNNGNMRLAVETWPFVRWYIEEHLLNSRDNDIELNEIFWGEFVAPTPGTPGADGATMDGIRKKLLSRRDIMTPEVTVIPTGALETDPSDFVAQMEKFISDIRQANPKLANMRLDIFTTTGREELFRTGFRKMYARDNDIKDPAKFGEVIDKNAAIHGLPSMNSNPRNPGQSSDLIWCTFGMNRIMPQRFNPDQILVTKGNNPRAVQMLTDWWMAVDFVHDDLVFVNELDSLTPQS